MSYNELGIKSFLNFGYNVEFKQRHKFDYKKISYVKPDFNRAKELYLHALNDLVSNHFGDFVVPISGGLDSRLILAGLRQLVESNRIKTYTFGTPGTYDYDLGRDYAKKIGVHNKGFNLYKFNIDLKSLEYASNLFSNNTNLFYHPSYNEIIEEYGDGKFIIGFMGDPISGSHLKKDESLSDTVIYEQFLKKNKFVKSVDLMKFTAKDLKLVSKLPEDLEYMNISKGEYIDFEVRQLKYVEPHVMFNGVQACSPFLEPKLFNYFMGLPKESRYGQSFYHEFLLRMFYEDFSYPCKNKMGLKLSTPNIIFSAWRKAHRFSFLKNKMVNYQDFNSRLREDVNLSKVVNGLVVEFGKRGIELDCDIDKLFKNHMSFKGNYADALLTIASLEVNLRLSQSSI